MLARGIADFKGIKQLNAYSPDKNIDVLRKVVLQDMNIIFTI